MSSSKNGVSNGASEAGGPKANKPRTNFRRSQMTGVSNLLPKVVRALGIDRRLKEHTLMNLWPHIVPEPFASRARPLFIDADGNLVVAVQDAAIGQEFGFRRGEILKLVGAAARGVGLNLNGLRFDMKRFFEGKLEREAEMRERAAVLPAPTAADLAAIQLSEDDLADFRFLGEGDIEDDALKGRMRALYEKELRLKRWREANGYPRCGRCGDVAPRLHGTDLICAYCFASGMSKDAGEKELND